MLPLCLTFILVIHPDTHITHFSFCALCTTSVLALPPALLSSASLFFCSPHPHQLLQWQEVCHRYWVASKFWFVMMIDCMYTFLVSCVVQDYTHSCVIITVDFNLHYVSGLHQYCRSNGLLHYTCWSYATRYRVRAVCDALSLCYCSKLSNHINATDNHIDDLHHIVHSTYETVGLGVPRQNITNYYWYHRCSLYLHHPTAAFIINTSNKLDWFIIKPWSATLLGQLNAVHMPFKPFSF